LEKFEKRNTGLSEIISKNSEGKTLWIFVTVGIDEKTIFQCTKVDKLIEVKTNDNKKYDLQEKRL
jgi:hypothetical protein